MNFWQKIVAWWKGINWGNVGSTTVHAAAIAGTAAKALQDTGQLNLTPNTAAAATVATVVAAGLAANAYLKNPKTYPQTPLQVTEEVAQAVAQAAPETKVGKLAQTATVVLPLVAAEQSVNPPQAVGAPTEAPK